MKLTGNPGWVGTTLNFQVGYLTWGSSTGGWGLNATAQFQSAQSFLVVMTTDGGQFKNSWIFYVSHCCGWLERIRLNEFLDSYPLIYNSYGIALFTSVTVDELLQNAASIIWPIFRERWSLCREDSLIAFCAASWCSIPRSSNAWTLSAADASSENCGWPRTESRFSVLFAKKQFHCRTGLQV